MSNLFRSVKSTKLKRNKFDLSFESNLTTEFGRMTPVLCQEVVAGDSFRIKNEMLVRMAALYAPTFSRVNCYINYYFCSHRLLNDDYEIFITGGEDGEGTITTRSGVVRTASRPYVILGDVTTTLEAYWLTRGVTETQIILHLRKLFGKSSLFDYLGYPTFDVDDDWPVDVLYTSKLKIDLTPFIAYNFIYNENYRDQNFQDEVDLVKDCQGDLVAFLLGQGIYEDDVAKILINLFSIKYCNWEKDYFSSALPFPQRGEDTTIGENDTAVYNTAEEYRAPLGGTSPNQYADIDMQHIAEKLRVSGNIVASVNEFRRAMAVQKFKEAMARYCSRYTEFLRGIFGTSPTDSRLQRPEFLGGAKCPIMFGEVLQTSETNTTPMGSYAGRGIAGGNSGFIRGRFDEPGWIIGILTIRPKAFYMQGLPKKFTRFDRFDFLLPQFANIGEQEIKQSELIYDYDPDVQNSGVNDKLFGYIPRYAEMRYNPSEVHGDFRKSLLDWHTARILTSNQSSSSMLNSSFLIHINPKMVKQITITIVKNTITTFRINSQERRI